MVQTLRQIAEFLHAHKLCELQITEHIRTQTVLVFIQDLPIGFWRVILCYFVSCLIGFNWGIFDLASCGFLFFFNILKYFVDLGVDSYCDIMCNFLVGHFQRRLTNDC